MDTAQVLAAVRAGALARAAEILRSRPPLSRLPDGLPILQLAVYARDDALVAELLRAGVVPGLHEAAAVGDARRIQDLARGDPAGLVAPGADGFTPLHLAAHFGRLDAVRALLDAGVDPSLRGGPPLANTPLHAAAAGGQEAVVRLLLGAGADPGRVDASGSTPLHVAAAVGLSDLVALLLAGGADRGARNAQGQTPGDAARARGHDGVVALLA